MATTYYIIKAEFLQTRQELHTHIHTNAHSQSSAAPLSTLAIWVLGGRYGPGPQVDRARLLVSNC